MERYTADDINRVSVVFGDRDSSAEQDDKYEPTATVEIEHRSDTIDEIRVGPDGAEVLHGVTETPEFEIDVTDRP